jgi:vacuolar protein sorting-associated protein 26
VRIVPLPGKRVEHQGIKVQLIGQIELAAERNAVRANPHDFVSLGACHHLPPSPYHR